LDGRAPWVIPDDLLGFAQRAAGHGYVEFGLLKKVTDMGAGNHAGAENEDFLHR
jgi:hypothetical protein